METCIELTAASLEDPNLGERLRSAPAPDRAFLLRQADQLRAGGEAQRRLAAAVYGALHGDIDPAEPDGTRRAAWFLTQVLWLQDGAAPLVRAVAERCADPGVRARARLLAAGYAEAEGDAPRAAELLRGVLESAPEADATMRWAALLQLARLSLGRGQPARALAFAARVVAAQPPGSGPLVCAARLTRADAFADVRDAARCERELLAADAGTVVLAPHERRAMRAEIAATHGRLLVRRGHPAAALPYLERALDAGRDTAPARTRRIHALLAEAQLDLGRADRAAAHLSRASVDERADDADSLDVTAHRIRLQRAAGGAASARRTALETLAALEADARRTEPRIDAARRHRVALAVADVVAESDTALTDVRRAWDIAAGALAEEAACDDEALAADPDLAGLSADDRAAMLEHRDRLQAGRAALRASLRIYFEAAAQTSASALVGALTVRQDEHADCAWCDRVLSRSGDWVAAELAESAIAGSRARRHAICDECMGRVLRRARGV